MTIMWPANKRLRPWLAISYDHQSFESILCSFSILLCHVDRSSWVLCIVLASIKFDGCYLYSMIHPLHLYCMIFNEFFFTTLYYIVHCTFWNSYCKSFTFQLSLFGICISQILCIKIRNLDSWPVFGFCHYILEQFLLFRTVAGVKTLGWLLLH